MTALTSQLRSAAHWRDFLATLQPRLFELPKSLESKGNEEYEKLIEVFEEIAFRFEEVFYDNTTKRKLVFTGL